MAVGRPRVLDEAKQREIVAMLTVGCSRSRAADYVGCAPSTLALQLRRDADFAERVRKAEMGYEFGALANIQQAGRSSWRAAAWHLEHTMPDRYSKRPTGMIPREVMDHVLAQFAEHVVQVLPTGPLRRAAVRRLNQLSKQIAQAALLDARGRRLGVKAAQAKIHPRPKAE